MIALIGIILLIGIVKKNGIMMIDFALDAERKERHASGGCHLSGLSASFSADHHDDHGRAAGRIAAALGTGVGSELRRPLGITMVGGLIFSQALTLYTTPVIYLWFDRLGGRFGGTAARKSSSERARTRATTMAAGDSGDEHFGNLIEQPVATTLLTIAIALGGAVAYQPASRFAASASRLPHHFRQRQLARRES